MAANSKNTPTYEYSKVDYTIIIVFADGEYPLEDRWESATFSPNADAGTMAGSGRFPRAHRATRYAPSLTISTDHDTADYIAARKGNGAIPSVKIIRQRPNGAPITDVFGQWNPSFGEREMGDDPTTVDVEGLLAGPDAFKLDPQSKNPFK